MMASDSGLRRTAQREELDAHRPYHATSPRVGTKDMAAATPALAMSKEHPGQHCPVVIQGSNIILESLGNPRCAFPTSFQKRPLADHLNAAFWFEHWSVPGLHTDTVPYTMPLSSLSSSGPLATDLAGNASCSPLTALGDYPPMAE